MDVLELIAIFHPDNAYQGSLLFGLPSIGAPPAPTIFASVPVQGWIGGSFKKTVRFCHLALPHPM